MKRTILVFAVCVMSIANITSADTFGIEGNQFTIDFVDISGDNGDLGSWSPEYSDYTFSGVNHGNYRMGMYEITNDQWNTFTLAAGAPTGSSVNDMFGDPQNPYDENSYWTGTNVPTTGVSWYEAAQFVNYLNTSTDNQAAYKFTGTQGTSDYTFVPWDVADTGYDSTNPFRNSNAHYFMPTEDEWVKAAYWNGTSLQAYATTDDSKPTAGFDANYDGVIGQPWEVGSGTEELNGTFDMMGNT